MKLATPRYRTQVLEDVIDVFKGMNNTLNAKFNEFKDVNNMTSDNYPQLSNRKSRELIRTLTTPNGMFCDGSKLCWVDGTSFYYDGVLKGTVSNSKKQFVEINKNILIFPDKVYYDTVGGTFGSFASGNPEIDYAVVHNNRVFGVKGQNIYASKQGDFKQWNVFAGLVTDSYATDVAGYGNFQGITRYQNHVVMQTESTMFELYGYKPENFQIQEAIKQGTIKGTHAEIDSVMYFTNSVGVFQYTGGIPRSVTDEVLELKFSAASRAGTDGFKYYLSLDEGLFVYDPKFNVWHKETSERVIDFAYYSGYLYALMTSGKIVKFGSGTEVVQFEALFSETFDGDYFSKSNIRRIEIYMEMEANAFMYVSIKESDKNEFVTLATFNAETKKNLIIPIIINAQGYELKLTGYGNINVRAIKKLTQRGGKR